MAEDNKAVRPRTEDELREALRRLVRGVWGDGKDPCFSIPANRERDADFILGDGITELMQLRKRMAEVTLAAIRTVLADHSGETLNAYTSGLIEVEIFEQVRKMTEGACSEEADGNG